jgi:hypothetical protein
MKVKKLIASKGTGTWEVGNVAEFCKEHKLSEATIKTIVNKSWLNTSGYSFVEKEVEVQQEVLNTEGVQANEHTQEAEPKPKKRKSTVKKAEGQ